MKSRLDQLIMAALEEDIGNADITSEAIEPLREMSKARVIAKMPGVVCGLDVAARIFQIRDDEIQVNICCEEGQIVKNGDILLEVAGPARSILGAERVALNILGRMCGIASMTRKFVDKAGPNGPRILDTRKIMPLWRDLAKRAVRAGGGYNHRNGLYDMVLLKENHLIAAGGITRAVQEVRLRYGSKFVVEVETTDLDEVKEALEAGVDKIMLDNMPLEEMRKAVKYVNKSVPLEASGNVTLDRIPELTEIGVDEVSVGALTHSSPDLDISLLFVRDEVVMQRAAAG